MLYLGQQILYFLYNCSSLLRILSSYLLMKEKKEIGLLGKKIDNDMKIQN